MTSVRVVLIEDHASFRQALETVVALEADLAIVGQTDRGDAAGALAAELSPDVAVVDLDLPGASGVEAMRAIRRSSPSTRCLVLTALRDEVELGRAIEAGAAALVHKSVDIAVLLAAIRDVALGATLLVPESTSRFLSALSASRADEWQAELYRRSLSPREAEVLQRLVEGGTNATIATDLGISPGTVQTHIRNLMAKLDVGSRLEAVALALRLGLVVSPGPGATGHVAGQRRPAGEGLPGSG